MTFRDVLEVFALALAVAAVGIATAPRVWPIFLAAAAAIFYLSHAWSWGDEDVDDGPKPQE